MKDKLSLERNIKDTLKCLTLLASQTGEKKGKGEILKEIVVKNFPKLKKVIEPENKEILQNPSK